MFAFASNFIFLLIARSLQGVAAAIPWTAGLALLAEVFPKEERGKVMGIVMSGQAGGVLLGPPFGGWLFELGGYRLPFFSAAAIALFVAFMSFIFLRHVPEIKSESFSSPFKVLRDKKVLMIAGVAIVGSSVFASIEPTLPIHMNENLNASPGVIGLLFVIVTLTYGLFAPLIGALSTRYGYVKTIVFGIVLAAIALPLNALPTVIGAQVITLALLGISLGMILTPALPMLADITHEAGYTSQGVTFATYNTAYSFGMMIGPIVASVTAAAVGLKIAYIVLGCLLLLYLIPLQKLKSSDT
nr:MFS transporter [Bacillus solimangrovi]